MTNNNAEPRAFTSGGTRTPSVSALQLTLTVPEMATAVN